MPVSTSISTQLTDVPEVLRPYITGAGGVLPTAQTILSKDYASTYGTPLQQAGLAGAGRVAGLAPMQQQIGQELSGMGTPSQFGAGTAATTTGLGSLAQSGNIFGNLGQVNAPSLRQYQMGPSDVVYGQQNLAPQMVTAQTGYNPQLTAFQLGAPEKFGSEQAQQYMSPYMQNVVDVQKREAVRDAQKAQLAQNLGAARQGTYGGARQLLASTERERALGTQLGDIQARGSEAAFQQAQQQFERDRAAGLTAGQQNLQAALGVQQLGTQTGLQTALANLTSQQQANVQNQAAQLQTQGLNAQQALQAALANQQAGMTVGQQNLQALLGVQQLGAGQSMEAQRANQAAQIAAAQGLGQLGQTYGTLGQTYGQLGTAQQASDIDRLKTQGAYGDLQRGIQQQQLDAQYQDLMARLNYPLTSIETMSNLARGVPLTQTAASGAQTTPAPSFASQLAGMGLTGLSLYNLFGNR
jgi:hypothetical protein